MQMRHDTVISAVLRLVTGKQDSIYIALLRGYSLAFQYRAIRNSDRTGFGFPRLGSEFHEWPEFFDR
jgi:hypothetical protein